jgi:hypothetical protein
MKLVLAKLKVVYAVVMRKKQMKVWNKRDQKCPINAVYVGRPTPWGNPFKISGSGIDKVDRESAIKSYRKWLECRLVVDPTFLEPLRGKDLVCWCAPKHCHADVLLEIANK